MDSGTDGEATKARKTRNERVQNAGCPFHSFFVTSWQSISDSGMASGIRKEAEWKMVS